MSIFKRYINFAAFFGIVLFFVVSTGAAQNQKTSYTLYHQDVVGAFYLQRDGQAFWLKNGRLNKKGKALLEVIEQAKYNGLNTKKYHFDQITHYLASAKRKDIAHASKVEFLLTDAYIEYMRDLSGMRIPAWDMGLNPKHWQQRISAQEALSYLPPKQDQLKTVLKNAEPQTTTYQALKVQLKRFLDEERNETPKVMIKLDKTLYPKKGDGAVPALRRFFNLAEVNHEGLYTFDEQLVSAVKKFQLENGLKDDGIIGKNTLAAINRTNEQKIRQIILNMERLRWVADKKPSRFIVVNIPAARLWAIEDGKVFYEMPVVVGRKKRQTLSFVTHIHGVRFNPTWTVPKTIKREDILPNLIENPQYLADKGMELYDGYNSNAPTLDPTVVDWAAISEEELKTLRMVQTPGAHNPLGNIRILMPNKHNIYLHSTNNKSLFNRADRAQSSGCIRMEKPEKIADFILRPKKGWQTSKMKKILEKPDTSNIYTQEKMPVYLLYYTTWLNEKGQIIYGQDIYDHDKKLFQILEKLDEYPKIAQNNKTNKQTFFID